MFVGNHDISLDMHYHQCSTISPIDVKLNNCSFTCFACNNTYHIWFIIRLPPLLSQVLEILVNDDKHVPRLHIHHAYNLNLINTNGDVQKQRYIMMDDVFIYHTVNLD